jgi:CRP-like cAMP-binding protein
MALLDRLSLRAPSSSSAISDAAHILRIRTFLSKTPSPSQRADFLRRELTSVSLFAHFDVPDPVRAKLILLGRIVELDTPGAELIAAGERCTAVYVLLCGLLRVVRPLHRRRSGAVDALELSQLRRGDIVGALSALYDRPFASTVVVGMPCVLFCLERSDFDVLVAPRLRALDVKKRDFISAAEAFGSWTEQEREDLMARLVFKRLLAGESIVGEGDEMPYLYFIVSGSAWGYKARPVGAQRSGSLPAIGRGGATTSREPNLKRSEWGSLPNMAGSAASGRELTKLAKWRLFEPGDAVEAKAVIEGGLCPLTVIADEETEVLFIARDDIIEMSELHARNKQKGVTFRRSRAARRMEPQRIEND